MKIEQELDFFRSYTSRMNDIFAAKRNDYGPSTEDTFKRYGPISMLTRMRDKLNRLDSLLVDRRTVSVFDERAEDTLLDLANYAIITILELHKAGMEEKTSELNKSDREGYRSH